MSRIFTPKQTYWADTGLVLMARLRYLSGSLLAQGTLDSITLSVWDMGDGDDTPVFVTDYELVIADTVFDTLQTDSRWTVDTLGYNWRYILPAAARPEGNKYRTQTIFQPDGGEPQALVIQIPSRALLASA